MLSVMASSDDASSVDTQVGVPGRSHMHRRMVCWHSGRPGHMRRRCFWQWRQQRIHRCQADTLAESMSAGGTPTCDSLLSDMWTLSHDWQLDSCATYHVTPHREWFSTFFALRQDDVHGVGDIQLQFASGSMLVLHDVQYVPDAQQSAQQSLISPFRS